MVKPIVDTARMNAAPPKCMKRAYGMPCAFFLRFSFRFGATAVYSSKLAPRHELEIPPAGGASQRAYFRPPLDQKPLESVAATGSRIGHGLMNIQLNRARTDVPTTALVSK
jgi:hypothetical protein